MPRVQTGNVPIPGEHLNDYLQALEARVAFRSTLKGYTTEFARHLATKYTQRTVRKHTAIMALFSDFLCDYTDVQRIEDVTRGMVNSQFRRWYKGKVWDQTDAQTCGWPSRSASSSSTSTKGSAIPRPWRRSRSRRRAG